MVFLLTVIKCSKLSVMMVAYNCEYNKNHLIVHFKFTWYVNCISFFNPNKMTWKPHSPLKLLLLFLAIYCKRTDLCSVSVSNYYFSVSLKLLLSGFIFVSFLLLSSFPSQSLYIINSQSVSENVYICPLS